MKRALTAVLFLAAALTAACGVSREQEPNDDFERATPVRPNSTTRGRIETPHDVDMFKLDVQTDDAILYAHVGGIRDVDFVLSVFDQDKKEIKRYDETGAGGDEEAMDIGVHRGVYYIVLSNKNERAHNPGQDYVLRVRLESGAGREKEPNDSLSAANPLAPGSVVRGRYFPRRNLISPDPDKTEADWFRVDVPSGAFAMNVDLSGVPDVAPILEIYDANAYKLEAVDNGGPGDGESFEDLRANGPVSYFLCLRAKRKGMGNPDVFYKLSTGLTPYRGDTELEPNDQRPDATPFGKDSITGTINPKGDVDWYRVNVDSDAREVLTANLSALPGMSLVLELRDALGNLLVNVDSGMAEQPEVLTGYGVTRGTYYLVVYEKTRQKSAPGVRYTLSKALVPFKAGMEWEPHPDMGSAQSIKVGEPVEGYIAPKGDVDWYQFNVYRKSRVTGTATGIPNVQLVMTLFDQEGKELQAVPAPRVGESASFSRDMDMGTYFLKLQAATSEQNNVRDKYTLELRAQ